MGNGAHRRSALDVVAIRNTGLGIQTKHAGEPDRLVRDIDHNTVAATVAHVVLERASARIDADDAARGTKVRYPDIALTVEIDLLGAARRI